MPNSPASSLRARSTRWFLLFALCGSPLACTDSDETAATPATGTVALHLDHTLLGSPMALDTAAVLDSEIEVTFTMLRYWLSNLALVAEDGRVFEVPEAYYLVEITDKNIRTKIDLSAVPIGTYTGLHYAVGIDPAHNESLDTFVGELEAGLGMDWTWKSGFIFFKAEGTFATGEASDKYAMHLGHNELFELRTFALSEPLVVLEGEPAELRLSVITEQLFTGLDFSERKSFIGGPPESPAAAVFPNALMMFP